MSRLFSTLIAAAGFLSCSAAISDNTTVKVTFSPDEDGLQLYMVNYDNGVKIDSAIVTDGVAEMSLNVESPVLAQLVLDGNRAGSFILEPGRIEVEPATRSTITTGALGKEWDKFNDQLKQITLDYQKAYNSDAENKQQILEGLEKQYNELSDAMFAANENNIIGYRLFLDRAYEMTPAEFEAAMVKNPSMAEYARVKKLRTSKANEAATSVGNKFKDFTIKNGNKEERLSDYVGRGKWTLVDFWASWCGPCIRETQTLKELYKKYSDSGLDILGVAVWDEPQNTQKAIEDHQLPWPTILNAQTIPTDIYGIAGIPCIILFDPEGNIVSRGKQGQDLVKDVEEAMQNYTTE